METVKSTYEGSLRCLSIHLQSGNKLVTDAPTDNHGKGEAFSPTDLLATSLGTCMATTMAIKANSHGIVLDGMKINITKIMASEPRRVAEVAVEVVFPPIVLTEDQKTILERTAHHCPVAKSLHPDLKQTVAFRYT